MHPPRVQLIYNHCMPEKKSPLNPDDILIAEYQYAAQSAFQSNEDRSKSASFFLVSVGSLIAAIFGALQGDLQPITELVLAGLFLMLTVLGALTVAQLARLREAWTESAQAMNHIKDFYVHEFEKFNLESAFYWKTDTIPAKYKKRSVSYYTALEVALLSGLTGGASVYFLLASLNTPDWGWFVTLAAGAVTVIIDLQIYKRMLK